MSSLLGPSSRRYLPLLAAYAAVYLIWGSTYLFISFADQTLPPFLMAGTRFVVAGALLYGWARLRHAARPSRVQWRSAAIVGLLLLVGGNGVVVVAEQFVPSGVVALLVSMVPIWIAVLDWVRPAGVRPSLSTVFGLVLGFVGVALLIGLNSGTRSTGGGSINPLYGSIVVLAAISWAAGSLYSRTAKMPDRPLLGNGMEMLAGGGVLLVLGTATGELGQVHLHSISVRSVLALGYLIVFGSLVAFTAYIWLLQHAPVTRVSTYAYVNPVVAVVLGWAFNHEQLTGRTLIAAVVIVTGVAVITSFRPRPSTPEKSVTYQPEGEESTSHV
jgi:drug/metabolite transporter (DMT)-like permease